MIVRGQFIQLWLNYSVRYFILFQFLLQAQNTHSVLLKILLEKQTLHELTYMWKLKQFISQKQRTECSSHRVGAEGEMWSKGIKLKKNFSPHIKSFFFELLEYFFFLDLVMFHWDMFMTSNKKSNFKKGITEK